MAPTSNAPNTLPAKQKEDTMGLLISSSGGQAHWGLLMLRFALGSVMFVAGWKKVFEFGVSSFTAALTAEGVPLPEFFAYAVTLLELVGGAFLVVGLLSRPAALLLAIDMVVAILLVTHEIGFLSSTGRAGVEINVLLIGGLLAILFAGPGSISLDRALEGRLRSNNGTRRVAGRRRPVT
jgi:putative oxidoreductase